MKSLNTSERAASKFPLGAIVLSGVISAGVWYAARSVIRGADNSVLPAALGGAVVAWVLLAGMLYFASVTRGVRSLGGVYALSLLIFPFMLAGAVARASQAATAIDVAAVGTGLLPVAVAVAVLAFLLKQSALKNL